MIRPIHRRAVQVTIENPVTEEPITLEIFDVTYYPAVPATLIDPPEREFVEFESVRNPNGIVSDADKHSLANAIEEALLTHFRN